MQVFYSKLFGLTQSLIYLEILHTSDICFSTLMWRVNVMAGWGLKIARLRQMQLALQYLKSDEIEA